MACFHPLRAFQCASGDIVFVELSRYDIVKSLSLPCGQCIGCRLERSRQWAMRCMHEASLYQDNSFVTLTYSDEHLPDDGSLNYPDFQLFMKRLRKAAGTSSVRFFMCGEYGPDTWRPHYHACLFNCAFSDQKYLFRSGGGEKVYTSDTLSSLWPLGHASVGAVTFASAAYVARYCVAKRTGEGADAHYTRETARGSFSLTPEFAHMSLKPGIGALWYDRYRNDVYPHDYVVVNGKEVNPPKYYDRLFDSSHPDEMELIKFNRELKAHALYGDNTPERLAVKEIIARRRSDMLIRSEIS